MVASYDTTISIYDIMRRHCSDKQLDMIIEDLTHVPGNKSFRETIERLVRYHERKKYTKEAK